MTQRLAFVLFALVVFVGRGLAQTDSCILRIRTDFTNWQPVIKEQIDSSNKFFNYAWGENYKFDRWSNKELGADSLTLSYKVSIIENNKFGYYVNIESYSFSGDWFVVSDYYYDINQKLYFVFWRLSTYFADEPVRVEKRLYFAANGEKIRELQKVYKMNTNEKSESNFMDQSVDYMLDFSDWSFYELWTNN